MYLYPHTYEKILYIAIIVFACRNILVHTSNLQYIISSVSVSLSVSLSVTMERILPLHCCDYSRLRQDAGVCVCV